MGTLGERRRIQATSTPSFRMSPNESCSHLRVVVLADPARPGGDAIRPPASCTPISANQRRRPSNRYLTCLLLFVIPPAEGSTLLKRPPVPPVAIDELLFYLVEEAKDLVKLAFKFFQARRVHGERSEGEFTLH